MYFYLLDIRTPKSRGVDYYISHCVPISSRIIRIKSQKNTPTVAAKAPVDKWLIPFGFRSQWRRISQPSMFDVFQDCGDQVISSTRLSFYTIIPYGDGSKPYPPVVNIKIAGIYGCSSPKNGMYRLYRYWSIAISYHPQVYNSRRGIVRAWNESLRPGGWSGWSGHLGHLRLVKTHPFLPWKKWLMDGDSQNKYS